MSFPVFGQPFGSRFGRSFGHDRGGNLTLAQLFDVYIATLSPLFWLRFQELSGTVLANSGSTGGTATWTSGTGGLLAQTGQLGVNEAANYAGQGSLASYPNNVSLNSLTEFTLAFLVNPRSTGVDTTAGVLFQFGNISATALKYNNATKVLQFNQNYAITSMISLTTTTLEFAAWKWVFATYSQSGDRKGHLYLGSSGIATEMSYLVQTPSVGTIVTQVAPMIIGNRQAANNTFDGLIDESLIFGRVLTAIEMNNIVQKSGL